MHFTLCGINYRPGRVAISIADRNENKQQVHQITHAQRKPAYSEKFVTTYRPVSDGGTTRPGLSAITGVTFATATKSDVTTYVPKKQIITC